MNGGSRAPLINNGQHEPATGQTWNSLSSITFVSFIFFSFLITSRTFFLYGSTLPPSDGCGDCRGGWTGPASERGGQEGCTYRSPEEKRARGGMDFMPSARYMAAAAARAKIILISERKKGGGKVSQDGCMG